MNSRRGSALLIVLGMLSFMVISAVSFAIYMRESRIPSSFLRRSSSSRYLLKAALANAMQRLDGCYNSEYGQAEGIYDDPYPGVGPSLVYDSVDHERNGDYWNRRVFTPFGQTDRDSTVSTLTLEGLAYLPPAIINEVRVYSRLTHTAQWQSLSFDAGRYAFSAVDVSDCFDINKITAGKRRTSAANERVSLGSLYEDNGEDLDQVLRRWQSSDVPFVSVADFNVAAGRSPFAPFCKFIGGQSGEYIYTDRDHKSVSNALFITDTWFPPTNSTIASSRRFNLSDGEENQPFRSFKDNANFLEPARSQTRLCKILQKNLGGVGLACLYDYLDGDSTPISFSIPTTETAAMICALGLAHNNKFRPMVSPGDAINGEYTLGSGVNAQKKKWVATLMTMDKVFDSFAVTGLGVYPFKRAKSKDAYDPHFQPEVTVKVFFAPERFRCRLDEESPICPEGTAGWESSVKNGIITAKGSTIGELSFGDCLTQADAVKQFQTVIPSASVAMPVCWKVEVTTTDSKGYQVGEKEEYISLDGIKAEANPFTPYDSTGNVAAWWTAALAAAKPNRPAGGTGVEPPMKAEVQGEELVPHVLVWARLDNGEDTVDVVPARLDDDETWGNRAFNLAGQASKFGEGCPILEFRGDPERAFTIDNITEKLTGEPEPFSRWNELYCVDPRFNYAPEDWFAAKNGAANGGDPTAQGWLNRINPVFEHEDRDHDIFMFTSDQEYMQSIGELQFLPRLQLMNGKADFFENDFLDNASELFSVADAPDFSSRVMNGNIDNLGMFANGDYMWRTYSAQHDPVYELRDGGNVIEVVSGRKDFRVNPLSQDLRVMMAALRDTPYDYYVASTNESMNETRDLKSSQAERWAFNPNSSIARMDDSDLESIARYMHDRFMLVARNGGVWERCYDDLEWDCGGSGDDQREFMGARNLSEPLHGVDRKYLYSFWRECFQNRQQLFLLFLRAEALQVGGRGSRARASSQLGARAVALVWRDPLPPTRGTNGGAKQRPDRGQLANPAIWQQYYKDFAPHRMRVLFYHQFD